MFFRRVKAHIPSFDERMNTLRSLGFSVASKGTGKAVVMRASFAAALEDEGEGRTRLGQNGPVIGNEIGQLTHGGNQTYFTTPSGQRRAATEELLKGLHALNEDLREALGLKSLYNESLGTVNGAHLYDRVENRDTGHRKHDWQR